jgi:eukaryotic-like serine/threonine-protein kinase
MSSQSTCFKCGAPLSGDSRQGFCTKCLFAQARTTDSAATRGSTSDLPLPRVFGDYELVEEVARGGMGIIYRARHLSLDRIVVVKMLLFGPLSSPEFVKRFRAEASAAASLQHPNIVAIHEVGVHQGQQYFSMDYVEGQSLAKLLANGPLPAIHAARYLKTIAEAIHYAHERGILHRDLKPSNVVIDANDQPRVTDFGLARRLGGDSELTMTGQVLGSPNYMPPEQAMGMRGKVSRRSDVYSLGAMLYHLLTGRPPFMGEALTDTLHQVVNADPLSPRLLNPTVPRDLETICVQCLEKEPDKRYSTAQMLAEELGRFLNHQPVHARPVTCVERIWRWCRRKPALASFAAATAFLLLGILIGSPIALYRINQVRKAEEVQFKRAEVEALGARRNEYAANMLMAHQALIANNLGRAIELLEKYRPQNISDIKNPKSELSHAGKSSTFHDPGSPDLRGWEWRYLWRQTRSQEIRTIGTHSNAVLTLAFSPDGKVASASSDRVLKIWEMNSIGELESFLCPGIPRLLQFDKDSGLTVGCAVISESGLWSIQLWSPHSTKTTIIKTGEDSLLVAALSPDKTILAGLGKNWTRLWNAASGEVLARPPADNIWIEQGAIAFSPKGELLAYHYGDSTVKLWDVKAGRLLASLDAHSNRVVSMAFSPDEKWLVSGSLDHTAIVWDLGTHQPAAVLTGHSDAITALVVSPDGRRVVSASADQRLKLWEMGTGREVATLQGHVNGMTCLAISQDGRQIVSGSRDQSVRLWRNEPKKLELIAQRPDPDFFSAQFSPAGETLAIFYDRSCTWVVFDAATLTEEGRFSTVAHKVGGQFCSFGPGGRSFAHTDDYANRLLKLWPLKGAQPVGSLSFGDAKVRRMLLAPTDNLLAVAHSDATLGLWDVNTFTRRAVFSTRSNDVTRLAFALDSSLVTLGYADGIIEVYHVPDGGRLVTLVGHDAIVQDLLISRDKKSVLSASGDGRVILWKLATEQGERLGGRMNSYNCVAESTDGRRGVAGADDGTIHVWDLASKQEVAVLRGHVEPVRRLAFVPDGNSLVSVSADSIRVWRAASLEDADPKAVRK